MKLDLISLPQELKNDLIATWNEIEETITSFKELSDEEIISHKKILQSRFETALYWLSKYVHEDDIIQEL